MEDPIRLCVAGGRQTAAEAAALEASLETAPDDVPARLRLLGYYFLKRATEDRRRRTGHICWLIDHAPELDVGPYAEIFAPTEPDAYRDARRRWLAAVDHALDRPAVIRGAASFLDLDDPGRAEQLLVRGARLEPGSASWPRELAHLHRRMAGLPRLAAQRARLLAEAVTELERAFELELDPVRRYDLSIDLARAAFDAGDLGAAAAHAHRVLAEARLHAGTWIHGNGVHHGHIVLGRVALASDDVAAAVDHLACAADVSGSPQLSSFGPDQQLAAELLARGERAAVLAYVDVCRRFYSGAFGLLGAAYREP